MLTLLVGGCASHAVPPRPRVPPRTVRAGGIGLSRPDVVAAGDAIAPAIQVCAGERHGTVVLELGGDGHVLSTHLRPIDLRGTATGTCIIEAARAFHVPPFDAPSFRLDYPFQLR